MNYQTLSTAIAHMSACQNQVQTRSINIQQSVHVGFILASPPEHRIRDSVDHL